jgi:hypothetical protein
MDSVEEKETSFRMVISPTVLIILQPKVRLEGKIRYFVGENPDNFCPTLGGGLS